MSYITLTKQYKENLNRKIVKYIKDELDGNEIEFDQMFTVDVDTDHGPEQWIVIGINEDGLVTGRNSIGDDIDFDLSGIDVETLSYMLDQFLEVNYKTLVLDA
jgi:hypothetical protein